MDHDARIGQGNAHPRLTGGKQEAAHRRGLADAHRADTRANVLHRIMDRHARRDDTARRVDVHEDVLLRIFRFEEQQLRGDDRRHMILDAARYEDDPFTQQTRIDVERTLAAVRLLHHDRHEAVLNGSQKVAGVERIAHDEPFSPYAPRRTEIRTAYIGAGGNEFKPRLRWHLDRHGDRRRPVRGVTDTPAAVPHVDRAPRYRGSTR
ncbi:hypothetical protein D9M73_108430 [compost metagenome]